MIHLATERIAPKLYDISPVISERIGVFPGDVSFRRNVSLDFKTGDNLVLSSIQTTLHLGAHTDGPSHYSSTGMGIGERDPWIYMGRCLVLHAKANRGGRVGRQHLASAWQTAKEWPAERILVRTESFPNPEKWNSDFCSFDPSLIEEWAHAGVKLIGIDTPSIDPESSKGLESHQVVAKHNMAILEGVVLTAVPEGLYTLIALPLKIEGADAAPVRAVLIEGADRL